MQFLRARAVLCAVAVAGVIGASFGEVMEEDVDMGYGDEYVDQDIKDSAPRAGVRGNRGRRLLRRSGGDVGLRGTLRRDEMPTLDSPALLASQADGLRCVGRRSWRSIGRRDTDLDLTGVLEDCTGGRSQQWFFWRDTLRVKAGGCLEHVIGTETISIANCHRGVNQRWFLDDDMRLRSRAADGVLCLDRREPQNGDVVDEDPPVEELFVSSCGGAPTQAWMFHTESELTQALSRSTVVDPAQSSQDGHELLQRMDNRAVSGPHVPDRSNPAFLLSGVDSQCVERAAPEIVHEDSGDGIALQVVPCANSAAQHWYLDGDQLRSMLDDRCLEQHSLSGLLFTTCSGRRNQRWHLLALPNGRGGDGGSGGRGRRVRLRSMSDPNVCIEHNLHENLRDKVHMAPCDDVENQEWEFYSAQNVNGGPHPGRHSKRRSDEGDSAGRVSQRNSDDASDEAGRLPLLALHAGLATSGVVARHGNIAAAGGAGNNVHAEDDAGEPGRVRMQTNDKEETDALEGVEDVEVNVDVEDVTPPSDKFDDDGIASGGGRHTVRSHAGNNGVGASVVEGVESEVATMTTAAPEEEAATTVDPADAVDVEVDLSG